MALGAGALPVAGCGSEEPYGPAKDHALQRYARVWKQAAPSGKYALQFLLTTQIEEPAGTNGWGDPYEWSIRINNGCLQNTAYDTNGGVIRGYFHTLFSTAVVEGKVPTAAANAYVSSDNPDVLVVESGRAGSHVLHLSGVSGGGELKPMDQETTDVLSTNGCRFGVVEYEKVNGWDQSTSDYITHTRISPDPEG